ncbi:MAG: M56 family metallopeptidase [Acidobacteria bacterium]|nr:M56 family metallopeptidase [Acidobacteriota bacterium]
MHEHVARSMYYFSVHLLYASLVGCAAWLLTSLRGASATTKYWIWVISAVNFIVPAGAALDKLLASHLSWAHPLGVIGGPVWDMTEGRRAVLLAAIWFAGAFVMSIRLIWRVRTEVRDQVPAGLSYRTASSLAAGVPVSFGSRHSGPAVRGILSPCIVFPSGIKRVLDEREFDAVLIHELAHAKRRDNLIRLLYEISLCALWFHPLVWLAGARMALYRELSCDECVVRRAQGRALLSALAKLAAPEAALFLQATASSHVGDRLAGLVGSSPTSRRATNLILISLFAAIVGAGIFQTIAHTACCFILRH